MAKHRLSLSAKRFKQLKKEIRQYRKSLSDQCEEFARKMAEEGVEIAKMLISSYQAMESGELLASMELEAGDVANYGATFYIFTGCDWAPFVEFGTGVMGEGSPHPDTSLANWKYDINGHGEEGWHYYKDGKWHWTKGMISRPFMYDTGQLLRDKVVEIAQEVFGDD